MRMVNISNEKSMQSYTARCSRYKNKYTNLVCGKTAVGRNYNLPRDRITGVTTKNREGFKEMIDDCMDGKIDSKRQINDV